MAMGAPLLVLPAVEFGVLGVAGVRGVCGLLPYIWFMADG